MSLLKKTVVHLITGLGRGGAERMLYNLCCASQVNTADNDTEHIVVSLRSGGTFRDKLAKLGIRVEQLGVAGLFSAVAGLFRLVGLLRAVKPACLQCWMYHANVFGTVALLLSGQRSKTRLIWGIRCSSMDLENYGMQLRLVVRIGKWLSGNADRIVANSWAGMEDHIAYGYDNSAFSVIENGVDTTTFAPRDESEAGRIRAYLGLDSDAFVAICVARNDPMKDYPLLLSCLEATPDIVGLAVGSGTETLPALPNLRQLGQRDDIPELLSASNVLVSMSAYGEGMSNSIMEAMSCGVPVVATDVSDAARLIADTGRLVPPRDRNALLEALAWMRDHPTKRRRLGHAARRRIESTFGIDRTLTQFRVLYD